jgi:glycosyltransferase involved in cell wall biosynthesis
MESTTKPLISFTVCAYNQEQYIQEAVAGAFAQTYSPLEIILSDDCSSDRTFEIMREMAAGYRGPHRVVLNRNPVNYGLGKHVNRLAELIHGEFVVVAAGDDVSFADRTEKICKIWEQSNRKLFVIQNGVITIGDRGELLEPAENGNPTKEIEIAEQKPPLEYYICSLKPETLGAALAYHPTIFSTFGPVPDNLIHEDNVIVLRALLLGSALAIAGEPLVKRRIHGNNIFSSFNEVVGTCKSVRQQEIRTVRNAKNRAGMYDAFMLDLSLAVKCGFITIEAGEKLKRECLRCHRLFSHQIEYADTPLMGKLRVIAAARRDGADNQYLKWMVIRLLPRKLFDSSKAAFNTIRLFLKRLFRVDSQKTWTK